MTNDPEIQQRAYKYFLQEAPELLQNIENNLIAIASLGKPAQVHEIMRATHTLKGAAANVGLETIRSIAHAFEDILKCLYNPDLIIDLELQALLLKGYECLRSPLIAQLTNVRIDEEEALNTAKSIFSQLQTKLGKSDGDRDYIPTSVELGFDLIQSVFEIGVEKQLTEIAELLTSNQETELALNLRSNLEVLFELATSFDLKGFTAIAQTAISALEIHPQQALIIGQTVLEDLKAGQQQVLDGDRTSGGEPSSSLQQLAKTKESEDLLLEQIWGDPEETPSESDSGEPSFIDAIVSEDDTSSDSSITEIDLSQVEILLEPEWEPSKLRENFDEEEDLSSQDDDEFPSPRIQSQLSSDLLSSTVRVKVEELKCLDRSLGELLINQDYKTSLDDNLIQTVKSLLKSQKQHRQNIESLQSKIRQLSGATQQRSESVLSNKKYYSGHYSAENELVNLFQKIQEEAADIEAIAKSIESLSQNSYQSGKKQYRLLDNMYSDLMEARMLPLKEVFDRFKSTIQQLEIMHGKPVNLKLSGTDVLVDKAIAEKLYPPLLHLVQNAFAHGIEPIEVRRQKGKAEIGQIEIQAYQQGGKTIIEVKDDGQGLNFEQIREQAIALNLFTPQEAKKLSAPQLLQLLFAPGFSTASNISELSGRGIGLEAVKAQIDALQGICTVRSELNKGTTFSLQIPISLMIVKSIVVEAGGIAYALLLDTVEKILPFDPNSIKVLENQKVLICSLGEGETLVAIRKLSDLIGYRSPIIDCLKDAPLIKSSSRSSVLDRLLLLRQKNKFLVLEVDQILGEQETVIKLCGNTITPPQYVYGCTVLDNTRLILVIDGASLLSQTQIVEPTPYNQYHQNKLPMAPLQGALPAKSSASERTATTILVVDDSDSQLESLTDILEKAGYLVVQARNGIEAIEKMHLNDPEIQLVVCDVEMPQLNGFEFLNYCRKQPEWIELPIVILTSRSAEGNRRISLGLGADAYFTKPYVAADVLSAIANLLDGKISHRSVSKFLPISS